MLRCPKCNSEYINGSNVCSSCGGAFEDQHIKSSQTEYKRHMSMAFKVILIICSLYALIGVVFWTIGMVDTNWSIMNPRCCVDCDKIWYSEYWDLYTSYTLPFIVMTFPLYMIIYGIENTLVMSVISIYLPFVPLLLVLLFIMMRQLFRFLKKTKNIQ